jgi:phosphoinositide-3-kinase regulatory subunit 4
MGARHTTLASLSATTGEENFSREILESDPHLSALYDVDRYLFPGSGRMMRTFRLRHKQNGSTVVAKLLWVTREDEEDQDLATRLQAQQEELGRIQQSLRGVPHMAPFLYWHVGPHRPKFNMNVRPAILLRPHFYTTLSDRLASRPFLTHVEKLWIVYQLLQALDEMHARRIVHGFLTTENIGLSSWNWVVLMDLASYKARTALPDNDPSEYLYFFQELNQQGSDSTPREKRCYVAPERFYTPNDRNQNRGDGGKDEGTAVAGAGSGDNNEGDMMTPASTSSESGLHNQSPLTPAMDIFSAGCVIMETFLNGERAFDLGDLMDYRKRQSSQTLQQKLNKIEFSALRAACRHMLSLDPAQRLSARAYLERLEASELVPQSFVTLAGLVQEITNNRTLAPDARLAKAAAYYGSVVYETMGIDDVPGRTYFEKVLGTKTAARMGTSKEGGSKEDQPGLSALTGTQQEEKKESEHDTLLAETEALLKKLEALSFDEDVVLTIAADDATTPSGTQSAGLHVTAKPKVKRSQMSKSSLLVYLQLVLSTVRHVQRPTTKLVALQLMDRVGKYSTDEARLQRIVPVTVSLLHDQDPLVRASAIQVLTSTISVVETFPPSDSKVFPQYIFKRVAHLVTDPSLVVRLAFARSVALLAETAHRFLDISHAVRLYEAVGGGTGGTAGAKPNETPAPSTVFGDDVARLLDESSGGSHGNPKNVKKLDPAIEPSASDIGGAGKTLISSTYNSELGGLHETVSRWVVHITTDLSDHSSPAKRALLSDMARLCNFFGLDGVMAFILPQVLSFLNDRKDWQLRASLFDHLQSVCQFIGRAATEHFVLPILEAALVDCEEVVISRALHCLSELLRMGLLSRAVLLGSVGSHVSEEQPGYAYMTLKFHF